ncbi:hypothetical protein GCM10011418_00260 [Sphingobacterium alkalisoli]|nr:hypothetical protein GCM10011418_00260 [Sphingobacterium alkalisoli]
MRYKYRGEGPWDPLGEGTSLDQVIHLPIRISEKVKLSWILCLNLDNSFNENYDYHSYSASLSDSEVPGRCITIFRRYTS